MGDLHTLLMKLPKRCQEKAVLNCLNGLLAEMRLDALKPLLACAEKLDNGKSHLRLEAILIELEVAIREQNEGLAVAAYEKLLNAEGEPAAESRSKALTRLGIVLLPNKTRLLAKLWEAELGEDLPGKIRKELKLLGIRLCKAAQANGDAALTERISQASGRFLGKEMAGKRGR